MRTDSDTYSDYDHMPVVMVGVGDRTDGVGRLYLKRSKADSAPGAAPGDGSQPERPKTGRMT